MSGCAASFKLSLSLKRKILYSFPVKFPLLLIAGTIALVIITLRNRL